MFVDEFKNQPISLKYRKDLRKNSTTAEKIIWQKLRNKQLGIKFRRQFGIDKYVVDFYCHSKKLIIEIDGCVHGEKTVDFKDKKRQSELEKMGFSVLRYRNEQVIKEPDAVIQDIANKIDLK